MCKVASLTPTGKPEARIELVGVMGEAPLRVPWIASESLLLIWSLNSGSRVRVLPRLNSTLNSQNNRNAETRIGWPASAVKWAALSPNLFRRTDEALQAAEPERTILDSCVARAGVSPSRKFRPLKT